MSDTAIQSRRGFFAFLLCLFVFTSFSTPSQAADDWRAELGVFRIGILAAQGASDTIQQVEPFKNYVQSALEMPVEIVPMRDHRAMIAAMSEAKIEYARFSATAFSAAWKTCKCVEPIVVPTTANGSDGFHAVIAAHKGGPMSLDELRKMPIIVPGKHSFSGYIFPRRALWQQGIKLDENWPVDDQRTTEAAMSRFLEKTGSALLSWIPSDTADDDVRGFFGLISERGVMKDQVSLVWKSERIPHGPHAVHKGIPGEAKAILSERLSLVFEIDRSAYLTIEPDFAGGFRQVRVEDYKPVIDALDAGLANQREGEQL